MTPMPCLAAAVLAALSLSYGVAHAGGGRGVVVGPVLHGHVGHGHWHGGHRHWGGGVRIGIGFGAPLYYGPSYPGAWYPGTLLVAPPPLAYDAPAPVAPMAAPEPVISPRHGQTPAQMEADRRACDRWAITQPSAMQDAFVFHGATLACMEERGYTVR
jgi:hypothetical protein